MRASIVITNVILIFLSSCYASQKKSVMTIDNLDSLEVQNPKNDLQVKVWGKFHSYTLGDGSEIKIPRTHLVSSYYISQDTLRMILSPRGKSQEILTIYYNIPVSNVESVTFRKFVVLFPLLFIGAPLICILMVLNVGD